MKTSHYYSIKAQDMYMFLESYTVYTVCVFYLENGELKQSWLWLDDQRQTTERKWERLVFPEEL